MHQGTKVAHSGLFMDKKGVFVFGTQESWNPGKLLGAQLKVNE